MYLTHHLILKFQGNSSSGADLFRGNLRTGGHD